MAGGCQSAYLTQRPWPCDVRPTRGPCRKASPPIERMRKKIAVTTTRITGIVQSARRRAKASMPSQCPTGSPATTRAAERAVKLRLRWPLYAVHRAAGGLPGVVRRARAEGALVLDDARVATDLLRPLGVPEEIRVVALGPDEDQVDGGHEVRHERAPGGGAR